MKQRIPTLDEYINEQLNEEVEETQFTAEQKKKIEEFIKNYDGDFKDEDIHKLADDMSLEHGEVEEYVYSIARDSLK